MSPVRARLLQQAEGAGLDREVGANTDIADVGLDREKIFRNWPWKSENIDIKIENKEEVFCNTTCLFLKEGTKKVLRKFRRKLSPTGGLFRNDPSKCESPSRGFQQGR